MTDQALFDITKYTVIGFALAIALTLGYYYAVFVPLGVTCQPDLSCVQSAEAAYCPPWMPCTDAAK